MPQRPETGDFSGSRDRAEVFEVGELDLAQERYAHALDDDRRGSKLIVGIIAGGFVVMTLGVLGLRAWSSDAEDEAPASTAVDPREGGRFDAPPPPEPQPEPENAPGEATPIAAPTSPEPPPEPGAAGGQGDAVVPAHSAVAERRPTEPRVPAPKPHGDDDSAGSDDPTPFANLPKPSAPPDPPPAEPSDDPPAAEEPPPQPEQPATEQPTHEQPSPADPSPSSVSGVAPAASAAVDVDDGARSLPAAPQDPQQTVRDEPAPQPVSAAPV